jgi:hypothetical protein
MILEAYQLAESVIIVSAKRKMHEIRSSNISKNKKKKVDNQYEYLMGFDHALGLKLIWFDNESAQRLNKMRMELMPSYDTATANQMSLQNTKGQSGGSTRTITADCSPHPSRGTRSVKSMQVLPSPPGDVVETRKKVNHGKVSTSIPQIKQLEDLLDDTIIGRSVNFSLYELCHHCKQLKPISTHMIKCCYSSGKYGTAVPACITINGAKLYNGTLLLV